jgi:cysteinyl-tRNA synthetase
MIQIHDTLAGKLVPLETRDEGRVAMYCCGPTVYNYIHIGNARTFMWFDFIRRYLTYRGYDVTYLMNYTDVDDRIIERSNLEGVPTEGITSKYARAFEEDMAALGVDQPSIICKATDHISDMVKAIEGLVERGYAYDVEGDVFFAVEKLDGYGKLSGRSLDEMRAGERVDPHPSKRHPLDFALWKSAKEGEPSWESPWGPGRPGWHIECSVMSTKYLGPGFDIHGGAVDLVFPHHENEIAQAEPLLDGAPFVRHWMHAAHVLMEAEKMSKSLGNVARARDVARMYPREAVRYWGLSASYRSQVVFSEDALDDAVAAYDRWRTFIHSARHALGDRFPVTTASPLRPLDAEISDEYIARFVAALDDDFNSAEAYAAVHEIVGEANKRLEGVQRGDAGDADALVELAKSFVEMTVVLGFEFQMDSISSELLGGLIDYLLELREQARTEKAFDRADAIRARLTELGVAVEDTPAGPRWRLGAGDEQ